MIFSVLTRHRHPTLPFFIAHLVSSVMYHADDEIKGKCDLHGGRRQGFVN